ncbi:hypothetical protein K438DRAFT_1818236 [Mycena galopus ATCC 62051]|nr:hypothetical protein K438DRAFT_1818236 [Mycena galopus ATCC 62051]
MSSFFSLFCGCCGPRLGVRDQDSTIDETSHLIPSNLESTPPIVVFTDHQRIQERLVTIVRAKERKMVNVNSQIPFNLHNRAITPNPSLSRSVSLSTGHLDHITALSSTFDAREPLTVQLRQPPSPLHSGGNPSQSNSRSISRTRDYFDGDPPNPILNVRLVNTIRTTNLPQRVGRPRHRAYGSPASTEYPRPEESAHQATAAVRSLRCFSPPLNEICLSWADSDP